MKKLFILLFTCWVSLSQAQNFTFDSAALYYTGQSVPFEISKYEDESYYAIALLDQNGGVAYNDYVILEGVYAKDRLSVPEELPSGTYTLIVSGLTLKQQLFSSHMYLLNTSSVTKDDFGAWETEIQENEPIQWMYEDALMIEGRIESTSEVSVAGKTVVMQSRGENYIFYSTPTNEDGYFRFDDILYGDIELFFNVLDPNTYNWEVTQFPFSVETVKPADLNPLPLPEELFNKDSMKELIIRSQYTESVFTRDWVRNDDYDKIIVFNEYISFETTEQAIKEIVPLVNFKSSKKSKRLFMLNSLDNMYHKEFPILLIDGVIVKDITEILDLPYEEVLQVKLDYTPLNQSNFSKYGWLGRFGVFAVDTSTGNRSPEYGYTLRCKAYRILGQGVSE